MRTLSWITSVSMILAVFAIQNANAASRLLVRCSFGFVPESILYQETDRVFDPPVTSYAKNPAVLIKAEVGAEKVVGDLFVDLYYCTSIYSMGVTETWERNGIVIQKNKYNNFSTSEGGGRMGWSFLNGYLAPYLGLKIYNVEQNRDTFDGLSFFTATEAVHSYFGDLGIQGRVLHSLFRIFNLDFNVCRSFPLWMSVIQKLNTGKEYSFVNKQGSRIDLGVVLTMILSPNKGLSIGYERVIITWKGSGNSDIPRWPENRTIIDRFPVVFKSSF